MVRLKSVLKYIFLFLTGGCIYYLIEVLWRGYSHWSMFILGGICFVLIGLINILFSWKTLLEVQMLMGSCIITTLEFLTGCIVNLLLGFHVWDYSDLPLNILGQICIPFSIIWFFISGIGIVMDDYIRYIFFKEEKPYYISWIINKIRGDNQ